MTGDQASDLQGRLCNVDGNLVAMALHAAATGVSTKISVIVTLAPGGSADQVDVAGLEFDSFHPRISAGSGRLDLANLAAAMTHPLIERIELDGPMSAMGS